VPILGRAGGWSASPETRANDKEALLKKAKVALTKGNATEALDLAGQAIADDPKDDHLYFFRGTIYEALERHTEAIQDFDKAVELTPRPQNPTTTAAANISNLATFKSLSLILTSSWNCGRKPSPVIGSAASRFIMPADSTTAESSSKPMRRLTKTTSKTPSGGFCAWLAPWVSTRLERTCSKSAQTGACP